MQNILGIRKFLKKLIFSLDLPLGGTLSLLNANVFLIEAVLLVWAIIFALAAHSFWKKVSGHKSKLEEQGAVL